MVRDIKSIVASLEKIHRLTESYTTDNMMDHARMINTSVPKRVDTFLNSQPLGLALERLQDTIRFGIAEKFLFIRAEDLVSSPKRQISRVYNYLGIEPWEHDFNNVEQITVEDDSVYGLTDKLHKIEKAVIPKDNDSTIVLGNDIVNWLDNNPNYAWYRQAFGYGEFIQKGEFIHAY
jgi:sulfotransferase